MMDCVLGIDLGTSYFKLALFDALGQMRGFARMAVPKRVDEHRCELDPDLFWQVLRTAVAQVCAEAGVPAERIVALSYASQANSFLLLDANHIPLTPLVLWPDRRATPEPAPFVDLWNRSDFLHTTGLGLFSAEFMAAKLCWFQQHAPAIWKRTAHILTISDFLAYGVTGEFCADQSTTSLLGLWDVQARTWWEAGCSALGIPTRYLSSPRPTGETLGVVSQDGACRLGLPLGIPLVAGGLDHYMAALGAGLGSVAPAVDSTGTVLALLAHCTQWHPRPGCCMGPAYQLGEFYQLAFSDSGAAVLEWYQRVHASDCTLPNLLTQAADVPSGADGLMAHASADRYPGLEGFQHASSRHRHGHYVRALLETTAIELVQLADALFVESAPSCIVATGGGARSDLWLQIKADTLGTEYVVTACAEPACLGAALVATVAANWFKDVDSASAAWIAARCRFLPADRPRRNSQTL